MKYTCDDVDVTLHNFYGDEEDQYDTIALNCLFDDEGEGE